MDDLFKYKDFEEVFEENFKDLKIQYSKEQIDDRYFLDKNILSYFIFDLVFFGLVFIEEYMSFKWIVLEKYFISFLKFSVK